MSRPLPPGWSQTTLAEVADFTAGRTPSRAHPGYWSEDAGAGFPWVTISDMRPYRPVTATGERISQEALADVFANRLAPRGTLLMSFKLTIGRVATLGIEACHNEAIISIFPKGIDQQYLAYYLSQVDYTQYQDRAIKGQTLNRDKINGISILVPPAREQVQIASVLDLVQYAIENEERALATTRELKRALFGAFFHEEGWTTTTLGELARLERGRFMHRPRNEPRFYGGATPFVQTGDVVRSRGNIKTYTQTLNDDGVAISRVFPAGTLLITIAANIGYTGILCFDSACPDSLIAITPHRGIDVDFLNYYLQTQQPEMDRLAPKGTQKNINLQFLHPWPVRMPPLARQREVAQSLRTVDDSDALHERRLATLRHLFSSLLDALMTGELRADKLSLDALAIAAA